MKHNLKDLTLSTTARVRHRGGFPAAGLSLLAFALLTLLVQTRALGPLDQAGLRVITAHRTEAIAEAMNWIFRLGFVQVDAALALLWAAWLIWRHRSLQAALPPLVLFVAIGAQGGLRLVVNQPGPDKSYELFRAFSELPVGLALDKADAVARETFIAATQPVAATPQPAGTTTHERGTYPSGHSCRILLLALLAGTRRPDAHSGERRASRLAGFTWGLALAGLVALVGYSTMYFGYHWPSDVLGGFLLAVAIYPLARVRWARPHRSTVAPAATEGTG